MNQLYRHKKTGVVYDLIGFVDYSPVKQVEKCCFVVCQNSDTEALELFLENEFHDGRFEKLYYEQTGGNG